MSIRSPERLRISPLPELGGFTLIEMVFFIVIVGTALAGLVSVLASSMKGGADTISRKQALAIAEAIVEEIALKPFTWCDPDDANAATATSAAIDPLNPLKCAATPEASGPEGGETRPSFDNVDDYSGYTFASPITDHSGTHSFPTGFSVASLTVTTETLGGINDALRVTVTVTGPENTSVTLDTYRTRYAPNFAN